MGWFSKNKNKYRRHGGEGGGGASWKRRGCMFLGVGVAFVVLLCLGLKAFGAYGPHKLPNEVHSDPDALWPIKSGQFVNLYKGDFVLVEELPPEEGALAAAEPGEAESSEAGEGEPAAQAKKNCRPFYLSGWNAWDISRAGRIFPRNHKTVDNMTGRKALQKQFDRAASLGLNVVRAWAHTVDPMYPVMKSPGKYDEDGLRAIDLLLHEAGKRGIRVILSFVDNWKYRGGVDEMVDLSETAPERLYARPGDEDGDFDQLSLNETRKEYEVQRHALFFTDEGAKAIYKTHVETLLTRKNTYSGVLYRNDPTVLAWNLINEARCESWVVDNCEASLQSWVEEMSLFVKSLDPNHLVTVGSEGFFAREDYPGAREEDKVSDLFAVDEVNPASWAAQTGQDFLANHRLEGIDFATVHLWPDTWNQSSEAFQERWINAHVEVAGSKLAKPLIVQEFGKKEAPDAQNSTERDRVYQMVNGLVEESVAGRGDLKGSLFWNWEMDLLVGAKEDPYTLRDTDDTWDLIQSHALKMHNLSKSQVYSCDDFELHPLY
mmetsp:Transcript_30278/g.64759  ORF Transcript_30278/g.64759 Transcript_30278/m.64759 type:complete len:546 (-) Transcript_30278:376-2013(-)